jgi:hypothetical protein
MGNAERAVSRRAVVATLEQHRVIAQAVLGKMRTQLTDGAIHRRDFGITFPQDFALASCD